MPPFPAGLLLFLLCQVDVLLADDCTTGFSVVAPELAVPGKTTAVLVTLHGPSSLQPLNVTLKLLPDPANGSTQQPVETTQEIKGHGILPLEIPADATGSYLLQTLVNCTGNGQDECDLQTSSQMSLVGPVRDVIIRPARHAYRPGETISFWVLALDHDLQIASGAIGIVSVKDTAGTRVAYWDQVSLDEGVKEFSLPLSQYARTGRWLLHVEVESSEFSAVLEVAPGVGTGLPDISAAEEHYVELRFGREMRRRYKPGLPFSGKVEAMSTEKSVRVRVKVYDNTTSIYSQDIEIANGEGTFIVPAILADSDVIALQAELVSVESKEIESHYVLAREPIHKWNSSSDCYLLIEGVEHTLQPDEEAHVTILSTCPCEKDLHYVITTDGRVTDWAQRRYEDPAPKPTTSVPGSVCKFNFSFNVRSVMAPVSQLLVYYVTAQGEPVSDVISFDVKLLHQQVYVMMEDREWWLPGQVVDLEIVAEPSSLVCLLGGRSGGNNDLRFDPRISEERIPSVITGEVDFLEAGVSFFQRQCVKRGETGMSAVSYRQRGSGAGPASKRRRPPESLVGGAPYDQLWLWRCFNYTSEIASSGLSISGPDEAGKWSLWALTVAPNGGLRFSAPVTLQVFRPLQAEFHLPASLRVRESLEVDIKIGNNINSCMDITALLALSEGAQFVSNSLLYVTERLRLGPHGATSLVVRLLVTSPGLKNMTVEVNGYSSPSCEGAEGVSNTTLAGAVVKSATVLVHPEGTVKTDTESAYFCANENILISPPDSYRYEWIAAPRNKNAIILEVKVAPSSATIASGVISRVGPVHIALAGEQRLPNDKMYRITLGDADNTITWVGRGKHDYGVQLSTVQTPGILSMDEWQTFWISWEKNTIMMGKGALLHNNTLLKWKMDKKLKIQNIGFMSAWGSLVEFRVWNFNDESGFSQVLHLDTPKSVVPGSESGELLVVGGLALPTLIQRNHVLATDSVSELGGTASAALFCGSTSCGAGLTEALASLATLLALQHDGVRRNDSALVQAMQELPGQIQTILSYRKADDSFSEHRMVASHKSTLAILEAISKVQTHFSIDPELIRNIKRWIQLRQDDDGSFPPLSTDLKLIDGIEDIADYLQKTNTVENKKPDGTEDLQHRIIITAETVITLYEIGVEGETDADTLQHASGYLESVLDTQTVRRSPETLAVVTLALVLVHTETGARGVTYRQRAVEQLRNATTTEDGEFGWVQRVARRDAADWLYESAAGRTLKEPIVATVEDFKASIHALATFCHLDDLKFAESIARYLFYRSHMLDKHTELLYPAVKAFALYDRLARDRHRALTISLATSGMELTDTIELRSGGVTSIGSGTGDGNEKKRVITGATVNGNGESTPTVLHLPSLPTKVFVYATGAGCATVQGKTTYSTYTAKDSTPLLDIWAGVVQEILPDRSSVEEIEGRSPMLKVKTCFRWKNTKRPSGVLRLEVTLFSGFELASTIPTLLLDPNTIPYEMEHGHHGNALWFVFANISSSNSQTTSGSTCPICVQFLVRSRFIISSLRPAYARIYPAERQDLSADVFFHTAHMNSTLLAGINDDDMITWFGSANTTVESDLSMEHDSCARIMTPKTTISTLSGSTAIQDEDITTNKPINVSVVDVVTYTINVDNSSIVNSTVNSNSTTDGVLIVPTALMGNTVNGSNPDMAGSFNVTDEIILQANVGVGDKTVDNVIKAEPIKKVPKKLVRMTKKVINALKLKDMKSKIVTRVTTPFNAMTNYYNISEDITSIVPEIITVTELDLGTTDFNTVSVESTTDNVEMISTGKLEINNTDNLEMSTSFSTIQERLTTDTNTISSQYSVTTTTSSPTQQQIKIDEDFHTLPKHVNTNTGNSNIAIKYLPTVGQVEEPPATFAPEMKNDKYVLLDKEELWGMLREVVHGELKQKTNSKLVVEDRLRRQGIS